MTLLQALKATTVAEIDKLGRDSMLCCLFKRHIFRRIVEKRIIADVCMFLGRIAVVNANGWLCFFRCKNIDEMVAILWSFQQNHLRFIGGDCLLQMVRAGRTMMTYRKVDNLLFKVENFFSEKRRYLIHFFVL
ncbi:hypothetical protein D1872_226920 [compost metagenome]